MKLSEYDDEDLIEEILRRGIKIEVEHIISIGSVRVTNHVIKIGGVSFELTK